MDRMAALALMVVSAKPPDRRSAGLSATGRDAHAFPIAAIAASARVQAIVLGIAAALVGSGVGGVGGTDVAAPPPYRVVDGKVDAHTYNGYRRYNAGCNHCHGPDGSGSSFAPSLVDAPADAASFRRIVRERQRTGNSVMKGFAGDGNVEPFIGPR